MKKFLARFDISTSFHSSANLKSLLSHTKSSCPPSSLKNVIYKIPCVDCPDYYVGQTCSHCWPLIKRIKEHEACMRLDNHTDNSTGNIKSAPAKHGRNNGHRIDWKSTTILATCENKSQLNLMEHAAIKTLMPAMNIQHKGPAVNSCWNPILPKIVDSFRYLPADIKFWDLGVCICVIWSFLVTFSCNHYLYCYLILKFSYIYYIPSHHAAVSWWR